MGLEQRKISLALLNHLNSLRDYLTGILEGL